MILLKQLGMAVRRMPGGRGVGSVFEGVCSRSGVLFRGFSIGFCLEVVRNWL